MALSCLPVRVGWPSTTARPLTGHKSLAFKAVLRSAGDNEEKLVMVRFVALQRWIGLVGCVLAGLSKRWLVYLELMCRSQYVSVSWCNSY